MAVSNWNISRFLSEVSAKGLSKPNRFEIQIDIPLGLRFGNNVGEKVNLMCDQAVFPYSRILTSRQQIFGPPTFHPVGVDYNGEGISLQFYVDREMTVKRFFDIWLDSIVSRTSHTANYRANYQTNIYISQLDESDHVMYKVKVLEAFPVSVQALTLDAGASNQVHKLSVNFNFRKWEETSVGFDAPPEDTASKPANNLRIFNGDIDFSISPNWNNGYAGPINSLTGVGSSDNDTSDYYYYK